MRRRVDVTVFGSIFVLRGWHAHRLAIEAGLRPTFSGVHQGWMADTSKLSTFEAYCAHRNVPLEVEGLAHAAPEITSPSESEPEPMLFEIGGAS